MDILNRQFGLVIAYVLPGFVALAGVAPLVPTVYSWLHADQTAGFAAPVYSLLAATAVGMVVSCFRWLILDSLHEVSGLPTPTFNARAIEASSSTFNLLIENHYRYYQFYGNTLVALIWAYAVHRTLSAPSHLRIGTDLGVLIVCVVLFAGSRDALRKYRMRSRQLDASFAFTNTDGEIVTNGIDHSQGNGDKTAPGKAPTASKPTGKSDQVNPKSTPSDQKQSK
jgi:hypothetical protein